MRCCVLCPFAPRPRCGWAVAVFGTFFHAAPATIRLPDLRPGSNGDPKESKSAWARWTSCGKAGNQYAHEAGPAPTSGDCSRWSGGGGGRGRRPQHPVSAAGRRRRGGGQQPTDSEDRPGYVHPCRTMGLPVHVRRRQVGHPLSARETAELERSPESVPRRKTFAVRSVF